MPTGKLTRVYSCWPEPQHTLEAFEACRAQARATGKLGMDLEFNASGPTIMGIASQDHIYCGPFDSHLFQILLDDIQKGEYVFSAYAGLTADKPVVETYFGLKTDLAAWSDPMLKYYLCFPDFAAAPGKDEDDDDSSAMGFYNLWACTSLCADVQQWKRCLGEERCIPAHRPCPLHNEIDYCGVDAWAGLICDDWLDAEMQVRRVPEALHQRLRQLAVYCARMSERGVKIDLEFVRELEAQIQTRRLELFPFEIRPKIGKKGQPLKTTEKVYLNAPFNPQSPQATAEYFAAKGITLKDKMGKASTGKQVVVKALNRRLKPFGVEFDIKSNEILVPGETDFDPALLPSDLNLLVKLAQLKGAGKGLTSWVNDKYLDSRGFMHPRFNPTGASTGRLSSSKPNFQNWPRVGFGVNVRKCVIPSSPRLSIVKADFSQLEFRVCLWYARAQYSADGAFEWLVENSDGRFERAARYNNWTPRDVAKSVVHATDYLEGLTCLTAADLSTDVRRRERKAGALVVYDGTEGRPLWKFRGAFVCFTGGNLSERLYGDRTMEHRHEALYLRDIFFRRFPEILEWHMRVSGEIENPRIVRSVSGRWLPLNGTREDDLKLAVAFLGQGGGADYSQEGMLRFAERGDLMLAQVHDEYVFELPLSMSDAEVLTFMSPMVAPSNIFEGFTCPAKVGRGPNWKEAKEIGVIA